MSTKQPKSQLNRQILDEASEWFVDFRVGDADATARERFDRWLRQSPEHIRAYLEIANAYVVLPTLNQTRKVDVQELIAYARSEGNVVSFDHAVRSNPPLSIAAEPNGAALAARGATNVHPSSPKRGPRLFAVAASIAIACTAASILTWVVLGRYPTYATDIGERRSITLADGSTIDLNARSKVRVKFSKTERAVELIDGQALFEVSKDKARPFFVRSGAAVVRAVGTQFDVNRKRSGTTVTVVEGRVAVYPNPPSPAASPLAVAESGPSVSSTQERVTTKPTGQAGNEAGTPAIFVSAGEQVTVTGQEVAAPKRTYIAAATAWTQHWLVFDASPLGDVVDDFNRYNRHQLLIEDRTLDDFHISGVYSSTDPASFIRFLRQQSGIDVIESDEGVRITRK